MTIGTLARWAILAASLFNSILLLWIGFTVLLSGERRNWGLWLTGGTLLLGGGVFLANAAILDQGLDQVIRTARVWWPLAWMAGIALPFAWYVVMLWHAGFFDDRQTALHRRHRRWLLLAVVLAGAVVGLFFITSPFLFPFPRTRFGVFVSPEVAGIPLLALAYPVAIVLLVGLALDVLRHPGPSARVMGDLARQRARPWLFATSLMLLLVGLLVGGTILWIVRHAPVRPLYAITVELARAAVVGDFLVSSLVAMSALLLGQGIVSYEIFTGKTLPRRGLRRHWRSAVALAAGYSLIVASALLLDLPSVFGLLLATFLVTFFYALFNRHSYVERERYIDHLRPFVASPRLYDSLVTPSSSVGANVDTATLFRALCADVLGTRVAYLVASGPLSPLVGPPLAYPTGPPASLPSPAEVVGKLDSAKTTCLPVEPSRHGGAIWAVPLWSDRGLIGMLLLGEKYDGGLYTQEEIEIARTGGERLIDTLASAQMAQRLVILQRRQLAENRVIDRRTRRVLHDDVLPRLHAAMLTLSAGQASSGGGTSDGLSQLADIHRQLSDLLHEMPSVSSPPLARLGLLGALRLAVDEELGAAFDGVSWQVDPEAEQQARSIPPLTAEVLYYAVREVVRNAAHHGRGDDAKRLLHLGIVATWHDGLEIVIEDDGVGLEAEGRPRGLGQGLALHSTLMAIIGGSLTAESTPGTSTRLILSLPKESWD